MDKIILIRTTHPESKLCSKLLKENKIKFGEIHSDSDRKPILLINDEAFSYRGLSQKYIGTFQIKGYVNSVKNYYKND